MNYDLLFAIITAVTGAAWTFNKFFIKKECGSKSNGKCSNKPWWVTYIAENFYLFLFVFVFRALVLEPFVIPSLSMAPRFQILDYVAVFKSYYSIKIPFTDRVLFTNNTPSRGEIIVFKHPVEINVNFIKRIIGLPGDVISYRDKRISVNGIPVKIERIGSYVNSNRDYESELYEESLQGVKYKVLNDTEASSSVYKPIDYKFKKNCIYYDDGVVCTVPADNYFVMGDNRDNSVDSRAWGFVPKNNVYGKAVFIWLNPGDLSRIGFID